MKPDVHVAATEPAYEAFPYDRAEGPVRRGLCRLWSAWGRDPENPLREWVGPGGTVVIKPNWVMDYHPRGHDIESLVTHTSVVAYMVHWCGLAMEGKGTVLIGDCPLQGCDFAALMRRSRMSELLETIRRRYPQMQVAVRDWRLTVLPRRGSMRTCLSATPATGHDGDVTKLEEYDLVDVGRDSFLEEISDYARDFRVTMYKPSLMLAHHQPGRHQYLVLKAARDADLLINLPKWKTHIKAGLTGGLKNLIGINGCKEFLPHHIRGAYFDGGDGYCAANPFSRWADRWYDAWWERHEEMSIPRRRACAAIHRALRGLAFVTGGGRIAAGSWSGNETLWRTILDVNQLLYFGRPSPRRIITVVDGVVAGEGEGPLQPTPKPTGLLIGGENPACIDAVLARLMGYNLSRIPIVYHALTHRKSEFAGPDLHALRVVWVAKDGTSRSRDIAGIPDLAFRKPRSWRRATGRA